MSEPQRSAENIDSVPSEHLARVDDLCDRFLQIWRDSGNARIEDFLPDAADPAYDVAFAELLHTEIELASESGHSVDVDSLHQRFPDRSELIAELCGQQNETVHATGVSTSLPLDPTRSSSRPVPAEPPQQLGRYRMERALGRGGMGAVYLAVDEKLDRQVALKIPHFDADHEQLLAERFEREARTMAAIKHQNLCTVFDVGTIEGTQFLTMEFVDGCSLAERLRGGEPFTSQAAAALICKVARALQLAHDAGVVHRDLKPGNILLRRDTEEPVVTDFGLARRVALEDETGEAATSDTLTGTGTIVGTPAYMSPEQAEGAASEVGPPSDIYSLGIILYELLAGRVPFQGSPARVIGSHVTQAPDRPSEHREGIDPRLEQLCLQALAKNPADRFDSVSEFADALDDLLAPPAAPNWIARGLFATAAAIVLAVIMTVLMRTQHGTLVVEISDPQIQATTDGVELTLRDRRTGINYTVGPGPHELPLGDYTVRVKSDSGLDVDAREFRLLDGEDARLTVFMKPVDRKPSVVGRKPRSKLLPPLPVATRRSTGEFYDSGQELGNSTSAACAAGDFDGDGDIDVVVANAGEDADRVWLNDGSGNFEAGQELPGVYSYDVKPGDLDADGDLDLVVVAHSANSPGTVWINNGDGKFTESGQRLALPGTRAVDLGDVDGDGDLDAVTCHDGANRVWNNDGAGHLRDTGQRLGASDTRYLKLGDLDNDGDLDLFTANIKQPNRVWWNDGLGQFSDSGLKLGEAWSNYIAFYDQDGDDDLDAAVSNFHESNAIWINDGQGSFTWQQFLNTELYTGVVAIGDLNGDGRIGAFVGNGAGNNTVGVNQIVSTLDAEDLTFVWHGRDRTCDAELADFDGDGDLDIFLANKAGQPNRVLLNRNPDEPVRRRGPDIFQDSGQRLGNLSSTDVALGDMDGDGDVDAVVATVRDQPNQLLVNRGDGRFEEVTVPLGDFAAGDVHVADVDGDDDLDVFFAGRRGPNRVWLNDGNGHLTDTGQRLGNSRSRSVALGDVDGDGDPDAWVAIENQPGRVWFNQGDGTFEDSGQALGTADSWGISLVDLDGDSDLDAVVANGLDSNAIWLNDGHGVYSRSEQTIGEASDGTLFIAAGDVDGDGDSDLVTAVVRRANRVWLNDGRGAFEQTSQHLGTFQSQHVALADVDGDGDLDAFFSNGFGEPNGLWLNNGDGRFAAAQLVGASRSIATALADLDGDGDLDAFVANGLGQPDRVWLNEPNESSDQAVVAPPQDSSELFVKSAR